MKKKIIYLLLVGFLLHSCNKLDLNSLSEGSSESWFSTDKEIRMSLDYLYEMKFWNNNPTDIAMTPPWLDSWTDDMTNRNQLNLMTNGTLNGTTPIVVSWWESYYQCIASANLILDKLNKSSDTFLESNLNQYIAEARFVRAAQFSKLIFYWGDVPYLEKVVNINEAFSMGRTNKTDILQKIYGDFDFAASNLPDSYPGNKYATKGAALALKARIALYMGDYAVARDAAKACMDLEIYQLHFDFPNLFLSKTKNSVETIFVIPSSAALNLNMTYWGTIKQPLSRIKGSAFIQPSWDLFCSFLCTDGLPIDESPLYNPRKPFQNRDPRCTATIVEHGTIYGDWKYEPHPDTMTVIDVRTGLAVPNSNNRAVVQWGSFNGLAWRKGIDEDWWDDYITDPDHIIIRYADVMLIYAEAMIELNTIDQSVLDAINKVRDRAYKVPYNQTVSYPAVTTTSQNELRKILRLERRMEFAFEALRHADIIRWRLAEKVLNNSDYGLLDPPALRTNVVQPGLWFFPEVTPIDDDGVADFTSMYNNGLIKLLSTKSFDKTKNYLWPIPSKELLINPNMTNNPGY